MGNKALLERNIPDVFHAIFLSGRQTLLSDTLTLSLCCWRCPARTRQEKTNINSLSVFWERGSLLQQTGDL